MSSSDSLLIDSSGAAAKPDQSALVGWAAEQRVFISSVMDGLEDVRAAAAGAIRDVGAEPVWFEEFGGRDSDPFSAYVGEVRSSTIYVGLIGARYGRPLPSRFSATHTEFLEAERHGLRLSLWEQRDVEREGPAQSFLDEVRVFNVLGSFESPVQLRERLAARLTAIAAEDLSPWVKLGPFVFRARTIREQGSRAEISAVIFDPAVVEGVRQLSSGWGRSEVLLVTPDRVHSARVSDVAVTTRASRAREVDLVLELSEVLGPMRFNASGHSFDELVALQLEQALFGVKPDLGPLGYLSKVDDPFAALRSCSVSEEAVRPVARLLLSETLALQGAGRLVRLELGAPVSGQRVLRAAWQPESQYRDQPAPDPIMISGSVAFDQPGR